jgi:hypothetical protein
MRNFRSLNPPIQVHEKSGWWEGWRAWLCNAFVHPHAVRNTVSSVVNWPLMRYGFVICCSILFSKECRPNAIWGYVCWSVTSFIFGCIRKVVVNSNLVWYSRSHWMSLLAQRPTSWLLSFPPKKRFYSASYRPKLLRGSVALLFVQCYNFITS